MNWPSGPPPMPPPGWYHDPEQDWTWRWWDGARWTDLRAAIEQPPGPDPRSFSTWLSRSAASVIAAIRRIGVLVAGVWLVLAAATWVLLLIAAESDRGRELRRLLDLDDLVFGVPGASSTVALTDAEADRVGELLGELLLTAVLWGAALTVVLVVVAAWTCAVVALVADEELRPHDAGAAESKMSRASAVSVSLRRTPAVLASSIVYFLVFTALLVGVVVVPVALVIVAGGGAAPIVLTVVFCLTALVVAGGWLWGRLGLMVVCAALGGSGIGLRRSWGLTDGNFWFVVGRLLVGGLIAGAATGALSVVNGFLGVLGFAVALAVVLVLNAVAAAAATIVAVGTQVVIVDQVGGSSERSAPA